MSCELVWKSLIGRLLLRHTLWRYDQALECRCRTPWSFLASFIIFDFVLNRFIRRSDAWPDSLWILRSSALAFLKVQGFSFFLVIIDKISIVVFDNVLLSLKIRLALIIIKYLFSLRLILSDQSYRLSSVIPSGCRTESCSCNFSSNEWRLAVVWVDRGVVGHWTRADGHAEVQTLLASFCFIKHNHLPLTLGNTASVYGAFNLFVS